MDSQTSSIEGYPESVKNSLAPLPPPPQIRTPIRPGTWHRLSLAEKIMIVQLCLSAGTFMLLVKLVAG